MATPPDPDTAWLLRPDGSVTVPAAIAGEVLRALVRDLTARVRLDGGEVSPQVRRLLYALHAATERPATPAPGSGGGTHERPPGSVEMGAGEAAALLGSSDGYVRRLARTGRVQARKAGPVWLIDAASLDAYRTGAA